MGIICGKCTKCLDLSLADTVRGFPPSRRCVFILLHPGLYYSSKEPMNILKANRAINPSKINLSGEMLHFYFRARSRPPARAAAPLRTQRRAAPRSPRKGRGGGLSMPCRGAERPGLGYAWELATTPPHPPRLAQSSWASGRGF